MQNHKIWLPYRQMKTASPPIEVAETSGVHLQLTDGRTLIDGIASWWTACHGYNHPKIVAAIQRQASEMPHVMLGGIIHPQAIELADRLVGTLGLDENSRVFFSDSGSVAVEVAMKISVQYWMNQNEPNRNRFLCFRDSYHGDTTGAMSLCDPVDSMHARFKGFLLEQYPNPIPVTESDINELDKFVSENQERMAAVVIEPRIQMAAGMRFHSFDSLNAIYRICRKYDLLFVADEVATGFGRTGPMFGFFDTHKTIQPDIICVGKALTGGTVGMAATIAAENVYSKFHSDHWEHALMHGPTFMGNPIACAAANTSLELFETEPRLQQVQHVASVLKSGLSNLVDAKNVTDVRVQGAVGVVQMNQLIDVDQAVHWFVEQGVWIRPLRDVFYLAPSFTITDDELIQLMDSIGQYIDDLE